MKLNKLLEHNRVHIAVATAAGIIGGSDTAATATTSTVTAGTAGWRSCALGSNGALFGFDSDWL